MASHRLLVSFSMTRVLYGNPRSADIYIDDLAEAITLLERETVATTWSIGRIRNVKHMVFPVGPGFGITLVYAPKVGDPIHVWEKAGLGRIKEAATVAIRRLKAQINRRNRDNGGVA